MPRDGALHGLGDPDPDRAGQARQDRARARPTLRASSPGRTAARRRQKVGRIHGGAGKRARDGLHRHYSGQRTDAEGRIRKIVGWEYVHVAIDDATRLAHVEVLADEKATTAVAFLRRAVKHYAAHGITIERLITDNGSAYISTIHAIARRALHIRHPAPAPTDPKPTARPNGSYARYWAAGHTERSTAQAPNATPPSPAGSTGTTPDDHTAPQPQAAHRSPQRTEQPPRDLHLGLRGATASRTAAPCHSLGAGGSGRASQSSHAMGILSRPR